jgi:N-acetylglucosaminyldiphosphoundecaprenol N-acetyl-beta-D-mannosaminyltransferase
MNTINILEIPLFEGRIEDAARHIVGVCMREPKNNFCISASGAHGIVHAQEDRTFKKLLQNFYLNLPDGMPGVWIGRFKGGKKMSRCYGPDFFAHMMKVTADKPIRHFFCGGNEGVAEELKDAVAKKFNNRNVSGTFCPPFLPVGKYPYPEIAKMINDSGCNILWIGLSTPKQEQFANFIATHTNVHFIMCVGAAFDFHTNRVKQAPKLIQKTGLEWLFRLTMEPKRLYKRYLKIVPLFIYYNLRELFTFATRNK